MLSSLLVSVIVLSSATFAFAETTTLKVEGMHCAACKKSVTSKVCNSEEISLNLEKCTVEFNAKTKIGTVTLISKENKKIDLSAIETAITDASADFKVIKKETK